MFKFLRKMHFCLFSKHYAKEVWHYFVYFLNIVGKSALFRMHEVLHIILSKQGWITIFVDIYCLAKSIYVQWSKVDIRFTHAIWCFASSLCKKLHCNILIIIQIGIWKRVPMYIMKIKWNNGLLPISKLLSHSYFCYIYFISIDSKIKCITQQLKILMTGVTVRWDIGDKSSAMKISVRKWL